MKPIQLLPYLKIHNDVKFLLKNENELIGNHILENLYEITIYLANTCDTECDICNDGYKQFICCNKRFNNSDIDLNELWHTFYQLKNQPVNINIIGNIKSINDILDRYNPNDFSFMSFSWYTHVLNIPDNFELIKRFNNLNVSVIISNPSDEKCVDKLKFILKNDFKLKFYFIIQSDDSLNQANDLIHKLNISDYVFQPFYNGSNYDFFMSNVFNSKKDIQNHKVSFKDILINEKININYFGRLIITNTGDIFTSFYNKKIGSIKDDIKSVILKELKENTNWRTLRRDYIPCKSCTYNLLCPPISNIEKALKKNNLCTIL
jgi:pseudo-rSAM protein